ncbi:MAG: aminotransferase class III-fold pyridoxal phosphate-dependent enzyme, partial [Chloroflexota bacterium]|nr:aminotransferase class III-fold pyridoxal phosphate-dependent enzyme [Chloroflexota bacterium]
MAFVVADRVLAAARPAFTGQEAAVVARKQFGVAGTAVEVDSERDQTFLIDGAQPAVLKISNVAEDPAQLDLEAEAAHRVAQLDPSLPVALPSPLPGQPGTYRAAVVRGEQTHWARMYDRLPGRASVRGSSLSDHAIRDWGMMAARVGRALRGFWHPAAARVMLWDVQHALLLRPMLDAVTDTEVRGLVERALDRYESEATPTLRTLRHQVIHTDHCASNTLVDDAGRVTGIVDFGDASWSALVVDLAAVLETVVDGREEDVDDFFRVCRLALDGYEKVTPLEPDERRIVGELVAARMCAGVVIPASRVALYDNPDALMPHLRGQAVKILRLFESLGWDEVRRRLGGAEPGEGQSVQSLIERRAKAFGPAVTAPTYREPLHLVRGEGVWLVDANGRRYLDAYNNVPVVGHEHPRVVEAIVRQTRRLNTNSRYLHETAIELAERLIATTGGALEVVMFVNSGSEANDLAWRIARATTAGSGGITTDWAYHGITDAINALTPEEWGSNAQPAHVRTWRPGEPDDFTRALDSLIDAGHRPAAAILDAVLTSDGIIDLAQAVAQDLVRRTHEAGALWIADEVQSGHGRTGVAMWGYQRLGITPDIVTVGKPMGNGMPIAAVLTRRELARQFSPQGEFFSTFGGNPVAAAAALAVLDVMDDERIITNARDVGDYLAGQLRNLATTQPLIKDLRSVG